jgi:Tol biopolymer transport system component/DNA-binding winged helix-turn-helix (wHTH) protein
LADVGHARRVARFDGFELDLRAGELRRPGDKPVSLAEQPFRILAMLLERSGDLVTRQEIQNALWPNGTVVEFEHSISAAMNRLRLVLSDSADDPRYIETLARRGYRWILPVEWAETPPDAAAVENAKGETRSNNRVMKLVIGVGLVSALLFASSIVWFSRERSFRTIPPRLNLRQLTNNSFENRVLSGAISPDGKYLAYTDAKGIRIQLVATGETRVIPHPEELQAKEPYWETVAWFPDSSRFVANAHPPDPLWIGPERPPSSQDSSVWAVSVMGGAPQKLREDAVGYSVSPDGSSVGFGTSKGKLGNREIWLMGPNGERARKIFETDEQSAIAGLTWSNDGKRALYRKTDEAGSSLLSRDLAGGPSVKILSVAEMKRVNEFFWLADGRLLYSVQELESFSGSACNFWEIRFDGRTGVTVGKPRQLTDWSGFCMSSMSETSDGKKLTFLKWTGKLTSFVGDLAEGGTRIVRPKHFPLSESSEGAADWTPDSQTIFFVSNRSGEFGIYKQSVEEEIAKPIVTEGYSRNPHVTPDGKNIVYLGIGEKGKWPAKGPEPVMRVAIIGGPSQRLFTARPYSLMTCARVPSGKCLIGEPTDDGKQLTITVIDPLEGRGSELFRFDLVANDDTWYIDVSPDGTRVAATRTSAGPIHILSLNGQPLRQIQVKGWTNLQSFVWAADGKGLFVTAGIRNGMELLHVDLQGYAHALWENTGATGETLASPSPDGRHLAFNGWTANGNMWMLENY